MNHEISCSVLGDILPLYMEDLTSSETSLLIKQHLKECPECQKKFNILEKDMEETIMRETIRQEGEINYLKKIKIYQNINLVLGAVISFFFGLSIPLLLVGIRLLSEGRIPDYYFDRLKVAWQFGLLKMLASGIIACFLYLVIMVFVKLSLKGKNVKTDKT